MRKFKLSKNFYWYYIFAFFAIFGVAVYFYRSFSLREELKFNNKKGLKYNNKKIFDDVTDDEFKKLRWGSVDANDDIGSFALNTGGDFKTKKNDSRKKWLARFKKLQGEYIKLQKKKKKSTKDKGIIKDFETETRLIMNSLKAIRRPTIIPAINSAPNEIQVMHHRNQVENQIFSKADG